MLSFLLVRLQMKIISLCRHYKKFFHYDRISLLNIFVALIKFVDYMSIYPIFAQKSCSMSSLLKATQPRIPRIEAT